VAVLLWWAILTLLGSLREPFAPQDLPSTQELPALLGSLDHVCILCVCVCVCVCVYVCVCVCVCVYAEVVCAYSGGCGP